MLSGIRLWGISFDIHIVNKRHYLNEKYATATLSTAFVIYTHTNKWLVIISQKKCIDADDDDMSAHKNTEWTDKNNERRKKNCESLYTNKIDDKQSNAQKKYDQERKKNYYCLHALCLITIVIHILYCGGNFVFVSHIFLGWCCYYCYFLAFLRLHVSLT